MLFDITTSDPIAFGFASLLLLPSAFAASVVPALRASRIDVVAALNKS
jgi:ABC-type lipoprotein release transport system permease subunit